MSTEPFLYFIGIFALLFFGIIYANYKNNGEVGGPGIKGNKKAKKEPFTSTSSEALKPKNNPTFYRINDRITHRVEHVIDGDTIIVNKSIGKVKVRLDSIDCPESGQYWGETATYGLVKLIGGKKVHLEEHGTDIHGRLLATIYVFDKSKSEWMNVNERMVTLGHAWVMRRYYKHLTRERQNKLNTLERWAKSKNVGLWRTENPVPPWQWRNQQDIA